VSAASSERFSISPEENKTACCCAAQVGYRQHRLAIVFGSGSQPAQQILFTVQHCRTILLKNFAEQDGRTELPNSMAETWPLFGTIGRLHSDIRTCPSTEHNARRVNFVQSGVVLGKIVGKEYNQKRQISERGCHYENPRAIQAMEAAQSISSSR